MADMQDLIAQLEKLTGPDREADADIFIAVTPGVAEAGRIDREGGVVGWWPKNTAYQSAREVPRYTASIDAALPGEDIDATRRMHDGGWLAHDSRLAAGEWGIGRTEALARRAAALRARSA